MDPRLTASDSSDPGWEAVRQRLILFARRRLGGDVVDGRAAEDFAQEALARCLEGGRRKPEGVALIPWLCGVVQSLVSHARARLTAGGLDQEPAVAPDLETLERAEVLRTAWRRVRRAISEDADAGRLLDALVLHWPEKDLPAIAAELDWTPARVRMVWRRITYAVRQRIGGIES